MCTFVLVECVNFRWQSVIFAAKYDFLAICKELL